jgi:hypothetical protein
MGEWITILIQTIGAEITAEQNGGNNIRGRVTECIYRGDDFKVTLKNNETEFIFSLPEKCEAGQSVTIQVPESSIVCLEE